MVGRISQEEADSVKEKLLKSLNLNFIKERNSLYTINGETVNVKINTPRSSGQYWFNIQRKANSYIWICYSPDILTWEAYYWIPGRDMWDIVNKGAYPDRFWTEKGRSIPNFNIDVKHDTYIAGKNRTSIRNFRNLTK